jgi:adenine phosphoribosyltransferase
VSPRGSGAEQVLAALVRDVPDFPKPGIVFKDISPVLADPVAFALVVEALAEGGRDAGGRVVVDKVVGIEARGFILAAPVALALGVGFVPVRKPGKLPGDIYGQAYDLEYGQATLEILRDSLGAGDRVLVIDDVLATGGTIAAAIALIERGGASADAIAVLMELSFLPGRAKLGEHAVLALMTV